MSDPIPAAASEAAPPVPAAERPALVGRPIEQIQALLGPWLDRPFRARQIHEAIHRRGAADFSEMTELPAALRAELAARFRVGLPEIAERRPAADGTTKYLLRLADGASIEAVDIPAPDGGGRHTLCISSQAGCALACAFCVTGYWGAGRNLTAGEIAGQVLAVRRAADLPDSLNVVFMGMGEPLLNLAAVRAALVILAEEMEISWRRITVSTSGIVPGIDEMAAWDRRPNLAVSLHAPDDVRRSRLMPINRTYPLAELLAALGRYPLETGRRITVEYLLIRGVNDAPADADALARRLAGLTVKVNLIPVNPDPVLGETMVPPSEAAVDAFHRRLKRRGLVSTVRRPRGDDVSAACGQLRAPDRAPRGFAGRRLGRD